MTKEVLLSIKGIQMETNPDENIEIITVGEYFFDKENHYVYYDEVMEENSEVVKSTLKFNESCVELIKEGPMNVHMIFEKQKKNVTYYNTPYGDLMIGILANSIDIKEKMESINVGISYSLEINSQYISNCNIEMDIKSKDTASLGLS